jgi:LysM repeat protein
MASYTIQKGDTLTKIAKRYGTTVAALQSGNNIKDPNKIRAGATLNIPDATPAATPAPAAPVAAAPAAVVDKGELRASGTVSGNKASTDMPKTTTRTTAAPASSTPSDADIRAQAEAVYDPAYQQAVDALTASGNDLTTRHSREHEDYDTYVNKLLKDTEQNINDSLIKRGMGRSTQGIHEVTEGLAGVNKQAQDYVAELDEDYETGLKNLDTQKQTLAATREQNIQSKILDLRQYYESVRQFNEQQAQREAELAAQQDLSERELTLEEKQAQDEQALRERELELEEQKLALASQSSSGGGGGGSRARSGVTAESIYNSGNGANANVSERGFSSSTQSSGQISKPTYKSQQPQNRTYYDRTTGTYYIEGRKVTAKQYRDYKKMG